MNITLRPIPHGSYVASDAEVISCTYNMNGFTPMNSVLVAHQIERAYFTSKTLEIHHSVRGFRTLVHEDVSPSVITSTETEKWDSISDASFEILRTAAAVGRYKSICFTQFAFVKGLFPEIAFEQLLLAAEFAEHFGSFEEIIVDVDEKYIEQAQAIWQQLKQKLSEPHPDDEFEVDSTTKVENTQLDPVTSTAFLLERAETGDAKSMAQLGQHYRNQTPILALKWLTLASFRGLKSAEPLLAYVESKLTYEEKTIGYKLSLLWLSDQIKKIEAHREAEMAPEFVAWMKKEAT
ncbi:hypothetical protein C5F52_02670 [Limnohabitans sp. TS-CS-82]|uniref:hypothetical protein n=1 Tax=Limnohabitans sp. TS-CS-82 TaxID=2094193 RepID=UPI000CF26491|nr:hypothetical protein [Limnohabitans sp. TS-CS-82]PQA84919.1 hypothetical protein C5F52_02670 [Limnohabitans sp. TS-CS-82]